MRNIVFRTKDRRGSAQNRAADIHNKLLELGYSTQYFAGYNSDMQNEMRQIRDSIVIYVKHPELTELQILKQNNNIVIIDVVDAIADSNYSMHDLNVLPYDSIIVPTRGLMMFGSSNHSQLVFYIPHHWDMRHLTHINAYDRDSFRLAYIGYAAPGGGLYYNEHVPDLAIVDDWADQTRLSPYYTCHYSIRPDGTHHYHYKPNSKISAAAAVGSNIIHSYDDAALDLISSEYPYFTKSTPQDIQNTIEYAKETFAGPVWNHGLQMMAELKHRTSLDTIVSQDYINYLSMFD
jgi:hypothetical protein